MDPLNIDSLHQRGSARCMSPAHSCMSMKSDWSMGHPINFREDVPHPHDSCEFSSSVQTADPGHCSLCSSILRDPVSIPCGHSYCKHCINTHWSQPGPAGEYACPWPECEESYTVRPELSVNVALQWMLRVLQQKGWRSACDVCCSETRPAIKTCVTCDVSYCENHVKHHYTVPAMQKHTLVQIKEDARKSEMETETDTDTDMDMDTDTDTDISLASVLA